MTSLTLLVIDDRDADEGLGGRRPGSGMQDRLGVFGSCRASMLVIDMNTNDATGAGRGAVAMT